MVWSLPHVNYAPETKEKTLLSVVSRESKRLAQSLSCSRVKNIYLEEAGVGEVSGRVKIKTWLQSLQSLPCCWLPAAESLYMDDHRHQVWHTVTNFLQTMGVCGNSCVISRTSFFPHLWNESFNLCRIEEGLEIIWCIVEIDLLHRTLFTYSLFQKRPSRILGTFCKH